MNFFLPVVNLYAVQSNGGLCSDLRYAERRGHSPQQALTQGGAIVCETTVALLAPSCGHHHQIGEIVKTKRNFWRERGGHYREHIVSWRLKITQ